MHSSLLDARIEREALIGPIAVFLTDALGCISWCNQSAADLLGLNQAEIVKKPFAHIMSSNECHDMGDLQLFTFKTKSGKQVSATYQCVDRPSGNAYYLTVGQLSETWTQLKNNENMWRSALDAAGHAVWEFKASHAGTAATNFYSDNWRLMRGLKIEDVERECFELWIERIHPDDRARVIEAATQFAAGTTPVVSYEYRERHADGHYIWVVARGKIQAVNEDGIPTHRVGVDVDITKFKIEEQKSADTAIATLEKHLAEIREANNTAESARSEAEANARRESIWRTAIDAAGHGIWSYDIVRNGSEASTVVDFCSDTWFTMRGAKVGDPALNDLDLWYDRVHPDDLESTISGINKQISGADDEVSFEYREKHSAGHWVWILVRGKTVKRDTNGLPLRVVGIDTDITDLKLLEDKRASETEFQHNIHIAELRQATMLAEQAQSEAQSMARKDPQTNLANRRMFREQITELMSSSLPFSVLIINLDRFKKVNDLHGDAAGDFVLRETAKRLLQEVGHIAMVSRLGSDEFAVILTRRESQSEPSVVDIAKHVFNALEAPFKSGDLKLKIGACIGSATFPQDGTEYEHLLRRADMALDKAKACQSGTYIAYDAEMGRAADDRAKMEIDLRRAIAEWQIEAWFQPILNAHTDAVAKFEVLARWQHPSKGFVSPNDFIAMAEYLGLLPTLSLNLLEQACTKALNWPSTKLSFNISAHEASDINTPLRILTVLHRIGFDPRRLEIEITEQAFLDDLEAAKSVVDSLRKVGIKVYVDDFGEGYAGIGYLRDFEVDGIKFDRSCVTNICNKPAAATFLKSLQLMAFTMNLETVAEGIETQEVWTMVKQLGCSFGQGYLFSKAIPSSEVELFLAKQGNIRPRLIA